MHRKDVHAATLFDCVEKRIEIKYLPQNNEKASETYSDTSAPCIAVDDSQLQHVSV
jgi:hypothetical protein